MNRGVYYGSYNIKKKNDVLRLKNNKLQDENIDLKEKNNKIYKRYKNLDRERKRLNVHKKSLELIIEEQTKIISNLSILKKKKNNISEEWVSI